MSIQAQRATTSVAEELAAAIADLDDDERATLLRHVRHAKAHRRPLDAISLVHQPLKARIDEMARSRYEELSTVKAPPVIKEYPDAPAVALPTTLLPLPFTLDRVLRARASRRDFIQEPLTLAQLGSLLGYSYGVRKHLPAYNTRRFPFRLAPSAGGLQPVEIYAVVNSAEGLEKGLYHYNAGSHALELLNPGNMRRKILGCTLYQDWVQHAGAVLVLTCVLDRVEWKYGPRGYRYVHIDVGCLTQNLYLVATALRLRACAVAAYLDDAVDDLLGIDGRSEFAVLLVVVGNRPPREELGPPDDLAGADTSDGQERPSRGSAVVEP